MANVSYFFASWTSAGGGADLAPGAAHGWVMWGFSYGHMINVSAHPVVGPPEERKLAIENVQIQGDPTGRRLLFTVRNVGSTFIPGYGMGFGWISS